MQEGLFQYLQTMIGNMQPEELHLLMRYITGSCVCTISNIGITFNSLAGLSAHTCSCTSEIPTKYVNDNDFCTEFYSILTKTDEEFSWRMDAL